MLQNCCHGAPEWARNGGPAPSGMPSEAISVNKCEIWNPLMPIYARARLLRVGHPRNPSLFDPFGTRITLRTCFKKNKLNTYRPKTQNRRTVHQMGSPKVVISCVCVCVFHLCAVFWCFCSRSGHYWHPKDAPGTKRWTRSDMLYSMC